jgi:excinuclease ABC subunit B
MQQAIDETRRRREIQQAHNRAHGITPASVQKAVTGSFDFITAPPPAARGRVAEAAEAYDAIEDVDAEVRRLEKEMHQAARDLDFERAAELRDRIRRLQRLIVLET